MTMPAFEKAAAFYLGKIFDVDKGEITDDLLLYDAKDLTTHAVCVGMTGSGKTGLCVSLLEEAAIDGIPAIAIDPKGDIGNLMLTFPQLRPEDFLPWVDEGEATRKGMTKAEYARDRAALWTKGLASWGEDGARIQRLRDAADVTIYTPGSSAGIPITILKSFAAPPPALLEDADAMRERVMASVSGLLALLGIDADPIRSREHILLSNILDRAWRKGRDLDLGTMIQEIQAPSFDRIGVLDLESFFPSKDRFELAMTLNNLLASPGFSAWMEGEALDVQNLMWGPDGKPRISILSIAHLSDAERMFFVTLLLNEVVAWMRTQSGSTSLRALLYMDEVFGFLPPSANPPSKTPMLTLLKQARAFGLGTVLATQNPVDLDYKALSNAGTWFLGRLQTERDKARVLDGLEGASSSTGAGFDRQRVEATLSGLQGRVFLMNNVHDGAPTVFHTRWAMSYLRGPLTRAQIKTLVADRKAAVDAATATPAEKAEGKPQEKRPIVPPKVPETFLTRTQSLTADTTLLYRPTLMAGGRLHFVNATRGIDRWRELATMAPLGTGKIGVDPWGGSNALDATPDTELEPEEGAAFAKLPSAATQPKSYASWARSLKSHLYREHAMPLWRCRAYKAYSEVGESEGAFRGRIAQIAREQRDVQIEKLRKRYEPKLARIQERIRKADEKIEREEEQYKAQKRSTWISVGTTILGALFGRRARGVGTASRAGTTMRSAGRASKEKADIERAKEDAKVQRAALMKLEASFKTELDELQGAIEPTSFELEETPLHPRKSDISVDPVSLAWAPWSVDADGIATPLF